MQFDTCAHVNLLWVMPYSWSGTIGEGTIVQLVIVYLFSVQYINSHGTTGQGIIGHCRIYESFKTWRLNWHVLCNWPISSHAVYI